MAKSCTHSSYMIIDSRYNKNGMRRKRCRCNLCGHYWLLFRMTPPKKSAPWPEPQDMPLRRSSCA